MKNFITTLLTAASLSFVVVFGCHKSGPREFTITDACEKFYRLNFLQDRRGVRQFSHDEYMPLCEEYSQQARRQLPPEEWKRQLACVEKGDNQLSIAECIAGQ